MSVFTVLFLLAAFSAQHAFSAPNERADRLINSMHAKSLSRASMRAAASATSQAMDVGKAPPPASTGSSALTSLLSASNDNNALSSLLEYYNPFGHPSESNSVTSTAYISLPSSTSFSNPQISAAGGQYQAQDYTTEGSLPSSTGSPDYNSAGGSAKASSSRGTVYVNTDYNSSVYPNSGALQQPSGSANLGGTSAGSGLQPYPSQDAPYQNSSSPYYAAGIGDNGTSGSGTGCPPQQTVTLPPVTVTLPAQTVTVSQSPGTTTITVTPQTITQTQTVTVTTTITAGPSPPYPSNVGSLGTGQGAAPSNIPNSSGLFAPAAASVPPVGADSYPQSVGTGVNQSSSQNAGGPALGSSPSAGITLPAPAASNLNNVPLYRPSPAGTPIIPQPLLSGASNFATGTSPATLVIPPSQASALNNVPLYSPHPAGTPILPQNPRGSGSSPSNAPDGSNPAQITPLTAPNPSIPYIAPYQNATGASSLVAPNNGGTSPLMGPTGTGFPGPTGGPTAPPQQSQSLYQIIGSFAPLPSANASLPPGINYTNTAPSANLGPVHPFTGLPAGPTAGPIAQVNESNIQAPPLSPYNANAVCSINHTITQNLTVDYATLQTSTFPGPLIDRGLNYTKFSLTTTPSPNHLVAPSNATTLIAIAAPFMSFNIYSITLSCVSDVPMTGNYSMQLFGLGQSGPGTSATGTIRTYNISGDATQTLTFEGLEQLSGLSQVGFRASNAEGMQAGVGIWGLEYSVVSPC